MNAPVPTLALETVEIDTSDDPTWYRDAVIYQLNVKAFADSNDDGVGDFKGVTAKLDYVKDLGVNTIWLMPFYPSPLRDDGYDISEYEDVHPQYGTLADFREMLEQAHARGLRVITELVINHTSSDHPWFQAARNAPPGSPERDFYVWSDTDQIYQGTRIIFTDTEKSNWTWDPVAKQYFWHRFFSHQPDLNFDNPRVLEAVVQTMRFWLDMGVDGFRLDAIPYLVERDGTSNENLPETHAVIKKVRAAIDAQYKNRFLLAEANMWPEDVREYFGDGDECHMAYHFPLMPRMYMAIAQEDRDPIIEILQQTPDIPEGCQWAIFLRNHDELTLEMVTSRERDYMYTTYAADRQARINLGIRRRLAPLMDNDMDRIKLMNSMLLSMPGSPIIYYGDEIGMGDNVFVGDRNGVRTPMQWSPDRNAGFSRADPQRLYLQPIMDPMYGYEAVNVETQMRDKSSLLHWTRRMLAVRKTSRAFGRGRKTFLKPGNRKILAYVSEHDDDAILSVFNLSRAAQPVELDLSGLQGTGASRNARAHRLSADRRAALPADPALARLLLVPPVQRCGDARLARRRRGAAGPARAGAVRRLDQPVPRPRDAMAHRHGRAAAHAVRNRCAAAPYRGAALVRFQGPGHRPGAPDRPGESGKKAASPGCFPSWRSRARRSPAEYFMPLSLAWEDREEERTEEPGARRPGKGSPAGQRRRDGRRVLRRSFTHAVVRAIARDRTIETTRGQDALPAHHAWGARSNSRRSRPCPSADRARSAATRWSRWARRCFSRAIGSCAPGSTRRPRSAAT